MSQSPVWLSRLSKEILESLSEKYSRPFSVMYGGPYEQDGTMIVEAFYNDIVLNQLKSSNPETKHSPRFGFRVRRLYDFNEGVYKVWVGFDMNNKVLAMNSFIRGLRVGKKTIASEIHGWLQKQLITSWLWFGQGDESYIWEPKHSVAKIQRELGKYAGSEVSLDTLSIETPGTIEGTEFTIERELKKFRGMSEKELKENVEALSKASLKIFKDLNFLYYHLFTLNLRK